MKYLLVRLDEQVIDDLKAEFGGLMAYPDMTMRQPTPLSAFLDRFLECLDKGATNHYFDANPAYMEAFHGEFKIDP